MNTAIYVRVSRNKQDHRSQIPDLKRWKEIQKNAVIYWFEDRTCGMVRPSWEKLEQALRAGKIDQIVVWRLDRLGRTVSGMSTLFDELQRRKVSLVSLRENLILNVSDYQSAITVINNIIICQKQVRGELVRDRQAIARAKGITWGGSKKGIRKKVTDDRAKVIRDFYEDGESITAISRIVGLSRQTIYSVLLDDFSSHEIGSIKIFHWYGLPKKMIKLEGGWKPLAIYTKECELGRRLEAYEKITFADGDELNCDESNLILNNTKKLKDII